jgi:DNA-binding Xre family transcriptional regulator
MYLRLRLPELLEEHGLTAYGLAKRSGGRISGSTAHRLVRQRGCVKLFDVELLEAMSDVLGVEVGELFERDRNAKARREAATRARSGLSARGASAPTASSRKRAK